MGKVFHLALEACPGKWVKVGRRLPPQRGAGAGGHCLWIFTLDMSSGFSSMGILPAFRSLPACLTSHFLLKPVSNLSPIPFFSGHLGGSSM